MTRTQLSIVILTYTLIVGSALLAIKDNYPDTGVITIALLIIIFTTAIFVSLFKNNK